MLTLRNADLTVTLLDPRSPATQPLQGTRYCWGGYIWQVSDARGDLLAGPEYPEPQPTPFNGQGLPESFRVRDRATNRLLTGKDHDGFVIGAGRVTFGEKNSVGLIEPAEWHVDERPGALVFRTTQQFAGWDVELTRTITLAGRRVSSATRLVNRGADELPLRWFAHPFFQLVDGRISGRLPAEFGIAENPAFRLKDGAFEMTQRFARGGGGHFQLLETAPVPLVAQFTHPRLPFVRMTCDFVAAEMPVWANHHTFSIEPYLHADMTSGARLDWSLHYDFGA